MTWLKLNLKHCSFFSVDTASNDRLVPEDRSEVSNAMNDSLPNDSDVIVHPEKKNAAENTYSKDQGNTQNGV